MRIILLLIVLSMLGCVNYYPGYSMEGAEDIKIIKPDMPGIENYSSEIMEVTFEKKQDGTQLILEFLKKAQEKGALYVSDITITINSVAESQPVSCVTEILPIDKTTAKTEPVYTSSKYQGKYVYKPVMKMVTEYQYKCEYVSKPVREQETYYTTEYDNYSKKSKSVSKTRYVTRYKSQQECASKPVTRYVTRYEYQYESEYIPPKLEYITRYYTTWELKESEPACTDGDVTESNMITGKLYLPMPK